VPDEPDPVGRDTHKALRNLGAAVGGAVVYDDGLEVAVALAEDVVERLCQEPLAVADDRHG